MDENCKHSVILAGLCAICGDRIEENNVIDSNKVVMLGGHYNLLIEKEEAEKIEKVHIEDLLKNKKLVLCLDIDQTIVHSAPFNYIKNCFNHCKKNENKLKEKIEKDDLKIIYLDPDNGNFIVKIRKGVKNFLERISSGYQIFIYTMGTSRYAIKIVEMIDPEWKYFKKHRIIARNNQIENGKLFKKDIRSIFPGNHSMVLALDDRVDVWDQDSLDCLIIAKPFVYFQGILDINSTFGNIFSDINKNSPNDFNDLPQLIDKDGDIDYLCKYAELLEKINHKFYSMISKGFTNLNDDSVNAKNILSNYLGTVLKGVRIAFSGLMPLNKDPSDSKYWKIALILGAVCDISIKKFTTHLVAANPNTKKVQSEIKEGKKWIVNEDWLIESLYNMERMDEKLFLLSGAKIPEKNSSSELEYDSDFDSNFNSSSDHDFSNPKRIKKNEIAEDDDKPIIDSLNIVENNRDHNLNTEIRPIDVLKNHQNYPGDHLNSDNLDSEESLTIDDYGSEFIEIEEENSRFPSESIPSEFEELI